LEVRGDITIQRAMAKVVNLARHIAHRELDTLEKELGWQREQLGVEDTKNGVSARNVVMIEIGDDQVTELFTAFGRLGVSAEAVAKEAAEQAKEFPASEAAVGEHLADQLMLPLALAGSGEHVAQKLTEHARTNITVIQQFLDVEFELNEQPRHTRVRIVGRH
jgi:RNA 3'-terminal phosphate cyclase (ATP)